MHLMAAYMTSCIKDQLMIHVEDIKETALYLFCSIIHVHDKGKCKIRLLFHSNINRVWLLSLYTVFGQALIASRISFHTAGKYETVDVIP